MLDITQQDLADAVGVSRPYIASIESGRANPSLAVVERIATALGLELDFVARPPTTVGRPPQRDAVHARCSGLCRPAPHWTWLADMREVTVVRAGCVAGSTYWRSILVGVYCS
jgi:transcriptional regulator with XRE-family HTH domain